MHKGHMFAPFRAVCAVTTLFCSYSQPWFVAGGWAIDLFLGTVTRSHEDVELVVIREDQRAFQTYFDEWELNKVDRHTDTVQYSPWGKSEWLTQSDSSVLAHSSTGDPVVFEAFFEDMRSGIWHFHRDATIARPIAEVGGVSAIGGIPYFAPEIILLWKSKHHRQKDEHDFHQAIPYLEATQRRWLRNALQQYRPSDPWLAELG